MMWVLIRIILWRFSFCFAIISTPQNRTEMVLYSKFAYGSQFSGQENGLKIWYLVAEILSKNPVSFFLGHPVVFREVIFSQILRISFNVTRSFQSNYVSSALRVNPWKLNKNQQQRPKLHRNCCPYIFLPL